MGSYGREVIGSLDSNTTQVLADGHDADWKTGGPTIDWGTVVAPVADVELPDGAIIPAGVKYLRYGETIAEITVGGKYGPHRTDAADGRQTLEAGKCFILNRTVRIDDEASDHPGVFDGGRVWEARLLVGGANQATLAQVKAAFPRLSYAR